MLAILGVGLLTLCGVCFVFGYAVGRRPNPVALLQANPATQPAMQPASNQSKPQAAADEFQPPTPDQTGLNADAGTPPASAAARNPPALTNPPAATPPAVVVQTALPGQSPPAPVAAGMTVRPALPQGPSWMVQIAAVSHPEDAEVLVGALQRHGYAVSVRRDPADGLMHVQVGPFTSHADAATMRQRLLNDGYNAVIQP
jgi:cell division septation protein DedD